MSRPTVRGIRRIDNDATRTYAWLVRLQRHGRSFHRYFSDGVYGGRQVAFRAALRYRQQLLQRYRPLTRREFAQVKKRNNRSGHVGVVKYRSVVKTAEGTRVRRYWIATWTPERGGPHKQRKFSIEQYGHDRAFELAIQTRASALARLHGTWQGRDV